MDVIDEVWRRFESCMSRDISEADRLRTKMSFYGGAMAVSKAYAEIAEQTGQGIGGDFCQAVAQEGADYIGSMALEFSCEKVTH